MGGVPVATFDYGLTEIIIIVAVVLNSLLVASILEVYIMAAAALAFVVVVVDLPAPHTGRKLRESDAKGVPCAVSYDIVEFLAFGSDVVFVRHFSDVFVGCCVVCFMPRTAFAGRRNVKLS